MPIIRLESADKEIFDTDQEIAKCSETIRTALEDLGDESDNSILPGWDLIGSDPSVRGPRVDAAACFFQPENRFVWPTAGAANSLAGASADR